MRMPHRSCPAVVVGCARDRARQGFTLIEVLVTLVILSTGIVLVLRAFETSLTALGESGETVHSMRLIQRKMSEIESDMLVDEQITGPGGSRSFDPPDDDYRWSVSRADTGLRTDDDSGAERLALLTLEVWRRGFERRYSVSTHIILSETR